MTLFNLFFLIMILQILLGPSYTYQADVLGSMEALKAGYKNVAEGYIDAAIVGVSSNVIDPKLSLQFLAFDFLSPDALCRCFDKNGNIFCQFSIFVHIYKT